MQCDLGIYDNATLYLVDFDDLQLFIFPKTTILRFFD